ncbi:MAG: transglutaminase-like domain-containing protein [Anaerolineaceae bacterium]
MSLSNRRWWDIYAAFLYLAALLTAATRLEATDWTLYLERVQFVALLAGILGMALGLSRFSPKKVFWLSVPYTLFVIPWQIGTTLGEDIQWLERLQSLGSRLGLAWGQFVHSQPVSDPILFLVLMSILFWVIGVVGGYQLMRYGNAGVGIITAGIALFLVNNYHIGYKSWGFYFGFFLLFSLLLLGRTNYLQHRVTWQQQGVTVAPDAAVDINRVLIGVVLAVVLIVWNLPGIAHAFSPASKFYQKISKPWVTMRDRVGDAFSSLKSSVGYSGEAYGDQLGLGTQARTGEDLIFTVQADEIPPEGTHYYWHGRSYDQYQQGVWKNTFTNRMTITADDQLDVPYWSGREDVQFTFSPQVPRLDLFYTAPQPFWFSRPGEVLSAELAPGELDVLSVFPRPGLRAGDVYRVTSRVSAPTARMLREADTDYPEVIRRYYLQVPNDLSPRVAELAQTIAGELSNSYDQSTAVTNWLRDNIRYSAELPEIPAGKDPLEWFLFEKKRGFCNYYATADVIMLRTLGIPARIAVGFAQGEVGDEGKAYTVRSKDAHAWVEVYFNNYGWVEFEPTVIQAPFVLPSGDTSEENPEDMPGHGFGRDTGALEETPGISEELVTPMPTPAVRPLQPWMVGMLIFMVLPVIGLIMFFLQSRLNLPPLAVLLERRLEQGGKQPPQWIRRWARSSVLTPLERAFRSVNTGLRWLSHSPDPAWTPADRVAALVKELPAAGDALAILLVEYERGTYSLHEVHLERAKQASRQVRLLTLRTWVNRRFQRRKPSNPLLDHIKGNQIG